VISRPLGEEFSQCQSFGIGEYWNDLNDWDERSGRDRYDYRAATGRISSYRRKERSNGPGGGRAGAYGRDGGGKQVMAKLG